jgi:poly(3-hydroxybutyrate) depolymerase
MLPTVHPFPKDTTMPLNLLKAFAGLAFALTLNVGHAASLPPDLPELNIDIKQTTVSGISSGAFMAVQVAVAKSASVRGVAAIAGGPYFCALQESFGGSGTTIAMSRCMQGDPLYLVSPITSSDLKQMETTARNWAAKGMIDPVSNLANQAVWVFHGYNDGIVKLPVSNALVNWYARFTPANQIFHKDSLNAAHAQISAACSGTGQSASCNICPTTGGKFINGCVDQPPVSNQLYDAAGAALQLFYGPLTRTDTSKLSAKPQPFTQLPYLKRRDGKPVGRPDEIAMGDTGYIYVPQSCQSGQPCRLHIAFHGCKQSATTLGTDFVDGAGVNEWADANSIVVLYPQAMPTLQAIPTLGTGIPINLNGCWDWWGYNDTEDLMTLGAKAGNFATKNGVQIAAVWRMVEKLTNKGVAAPATYISGVTTTLTVVDQSAKQAVLRWQPVSGASSYRVYRSSTGKAPKALSGTIAQPFLVDTGLAPSSSYTYTVRALIAGKEAPDSNAVSVTTARKPPACDPYFSMELDTPVKKVIGVPTGLPTKEVCQ